MRLAMEEVETKTRISEKIRNLNLSCGHPDEGRYVRVLARLRERIDHLNEHIGRLEKRVGRY